MNKTMLHSTNPIFKDNIINFLQNLEKNIEYSPKKDVVLLLGNTGSGKTSLALYISGNDDKMLSTDVVKGIGEYVIVDKQNKISSRSTIVSQTIYPELVKDTNSSTLYYDCPGFSDTRSAYHEITATYLIKKLIESVESVKMVFVVSYHAVTRGADRQDFILAMRHATDFIKEIERFKNSIALVVTKVENRYVGNNIVPDETVINAIGNYLEQVMLDINEYPEMVNSPGQTSDTKEKIISLLEIFLSRGANGHGKRIGIFRRPNEPGPIRDIVLLKKGKTQLQNLINKQIKFVEVRDKDFGYTVSAKAKVYIGTVEEEINQNILKEIIDIGQKVIEYCISFEKETSDLGYLALKFQTLLESFSELRGKAMSDRIISEEVINYIDEIIKTFEIPIPDTYINAAKKNFNFINFLDLVSNQSIRNNKASRLAAGLSKLIEYLNDSNSFYSFLNTMYERLTEFDIQKNRRNYQAINVTDFNDILTFPFFKKIEAIIKANFGFKKTKFNEHQLKLLNRVLDETLKYETEVIKPDDDKIRVKGFSVKLSDHKELVNMTDVKFLEVYALHKVFIDTSFDLTGKEIQIVIIAPVWEVVGSQSIILDGKPAMDYEPLKAGNGIWNEKQLFSEPGIDGKPGRPGGPAGNFIGIGKDYINVKYMHISANGGMGGRGQDGGDGSEGSNDWYFSDINKDGGHGGSGGIGGYGGSKGFIYINKIGTESGVVLAKETAVDGHPGVDGIGGKGGKAGNHVELTFIFLFYFIPFFVPKPTGRKYKNGQPGKRGANQNGRKSPRQLTKIINLNDVKMKYKNYCLNNLNNNLQETFLRKFLEVIDNCNESITEEKSKPMNRKIINMSVKDFAKKTLSFVNSFPTFS